MAAKEVWVLVADAASARVLRADREGRRLELLRTHSHPEGRAKPGNLVSDRPGRSFESGHTGARHAMEPDTELKRAELRRFVHRLASELDAAALADSFDQLVIVAADRVLGELRKALSPQVAARICQEIDKDLAGPGGRATGRAPRAGAVALMVACNRYGQVHAAAHRLIGLSGVRMSTELDFPHVQRATGDQSVRLTHRAS